MGKRDSSILNNLKLIRSDEERGLRETMKKKTKYKDGTGLLGKIMQEIKKSRK